MRAYPTVYKSCAQPVILIWKEHFHELFWATTAMWWWSILKSSWCWVIHSFCTIYSAWVTFLLYFLKTVVKLASIFADFMLDVSKTKSLNLCREGGIECGWGCVALGQGDSGSSLSADIHTHTHIHTHIYTNGIFYLLLFIFIILPHPRPQILWNSLLFNTWKPKLCIQTNYSKLQYNIPSPEWIQQS